jgi:DNA-binding PadR family transcriptional regulator
MYELIILSLLMRFPMHGYLIAKVTNDQIGPWAKISSGTLYTILTKLEQTGLIVAQLQEGDVTAGGHRSRTFVITEEGRKRFHQIMMDTSASLGDYQRIFRYKFAYLDLLQPHERLLLLDHYVNYCQTSMLYLETEMSTLPSELSFYSDPVYLESLLAMLRQVQSQWEGELIWARAMRERERGQPA